MALGEGHYEELPFVVCAPFRSETLHIDVHGRLTLCCLHSGIPGDGRRSDVGGDLATMPLADAHGVLLGVIHAAQSDKLARMARAGLSEWAHFACNDCLGAFGRPHWTDGAGTGGPTAKR